MHDGMKGFAIASLALVLAGCPASTPTPPPEAPGPQEPMAAPRTAFELDDNRLILPGPIGFGGDDGTELDTAASAGALAHIRDFLASRSDVTMVRLEGHSAGDASENDVMFTGEQALNVGNWLIAQGVACERLIIAGFGGSKPVADGSTPEGQAQNVRIEVVVAALRGNLIGGMDAGGNAPAAVPACPI